MRRVRPARFGWGLPAEEFLYHLPRSSRRCGCGLGPARLGFLPLHANPGSRNRSGWGCHPKSPLHCRHRGADTPGMRCPTTGQRALRPRLPGRTAGFRRAGGGTSPRGSWAPHVQDQHAPPWALVQKCQDAIPVCGCAHRGITARPRRRNRSAASWADRGPERHFDARVSWRIAAGPVLRGVGVPEVSRLRPQPCTVLGKRLWRCPQASATPSAASRVCSAFDCVL